MKCVIFSVLLFFSAFSQSAYSQSQIDINEVLNNYSKRTGVNFIVDPRIRGQVNIIGLELDEIDKTDLNKILLLHNMVAYKKSDVVYIIPIQVEKEKGSRIGEKWESND